MSILPTVNPPLFTIFTPTYNRAHTIRRVFDSLCAQTLRDFEWLVIDDGSTDNTSELIAIWDEIANFPVRCVKQTHAGKHFAHNRALVEAKGQFFGILDSDDALVPDALEKLARLWDSIPESERHLFCSVGARCCSQNGSIIGDRFPTDPFDADMRELAYVYHIDGEKWICWVTEVFRRYPFPEITGIQFIPEGLICYSIAKAYRGRWSNDAVRVYYVNDQETGPTLSKRRQSDHALGRWHYYTWLLNNDLEYIFRSPRPFIKAAILVPICAWFSGKTLNESLRELTSILAKFLVFSTLPVSTLIYLIETCRLRAASGHRSTMPVRPHQ